MQTGWDVCWVAVGSQLGELPRKAKEKHFYQPVFQPGPNQRWQALSSGYPKPTGAHTHTHELVWECAWWVTGVSLGRIIVSFSHGNKVLVMVWWKSYAVTAETKLRMKNRMQLQLSESVSWVPVLDSWIFFFRPFFDVLIHVSAAKLTFYLLSSW